MISIKKYLDLATDAKKERTPASKDGLLTSALNAYRSTILAMAEQAARACPATGRDLQSELKKVSTFSPELTPALLDETGVRIEQQLRLWSDQTVQNSNQTANDVREILLVLAKTGEEVCIRDQRYAGKFDEITRQLNSIAHLEDISQVRAMVMKSAANLKSSTAMMTEDGRESMAQLRAQVSSYQCRLEKAEQLASRDCLTGLRNRLNIEGQLQRRLEEQKIFSLIMIDLNGFKIVNDTYGHAVGDDLLKQFAFEVSSFSNSTDVVGRWGGDEFLVIIDSPLSESQPRVQRMKDWVCGEYDLDVQSTKIKVELSAAIGVVESKPDDTVASIVQRTDLAMYQEKKAAQITKGLNNQQPPHAGSPHGPLEARPS